MRSVKARTVQQLGWERYIALTTFRKSGAEVTTPVWVARRGEELLVVTGPQTGKVKRIRHTPRVELRGSDVRGRVNERMETTAGVAEVLSSESDVKAAEEVFREKYGWQFAAATFVEHLFARGEAAGRVVLSIRAA